MGKNQNTNDPLKAVIDAALNLQFDKIAIEVRKFHSRGLVLGDNGVEHDGYWTREIDYNNISGLLKNDAQLMHFLPILKSLIENTQSELKSETKPEMRYKILSKALSLLQSEKIIHFFDKAITYSVEARNHILQGIKREGRTKFLNSWDKGLQKDINEYTTLKQNVNDFLIEYAKLSVAPSVLFGSMFRVENPQTEEKKESLQKRSRSLSF